MASNDRAGISFAQPLEKAGRVAVAAKCCSALEISLPLLVDEIDDRVGHAYSGMPDRLYVIDREGKVAYKGGRGPFGFKPREMEQSLVMLLLDQTEKPQPGPERLPLLDNDAAWKRLPGAPAAAEPLPAWARLLAGPLPATTARMLELDALHRTGTRLDPKLRGWARWAAADADGCDYARAVAAADLRRAGVTEAELRAHAADQRGLAPAEQAAVSFARKMMREAHAVTDAEVQQLLKLLGEEQLVALVALVAHASFQDRLFLAMNVQVEPGGPLPPLSVMFPKPKPPGHPPAAAPQPDKPAASTAVPAPLAEWLDLQAGLDRQRARPGRIRVPSRAEVLKRIGEEHTAAWQAGILWSRVCYGFQPELTDAWFACAAAFRPEAKLDRVLEQCVFWVVTQALQCFY